MGTDPISRTNQGQTTFNLIVQGPALDEKAVHALAAIANPSAVEQIASGLGQGERRLVLDLTGVAFLDSTALGTMIGALRRIREAEGVMRVVLPETAARRIFDITGLVPVLDVYPNRDAALAG